MALPFRFKAKTLIEEKRIKQESLDNIKSWLNKKQLPKFPDEFIALFLLSCDNTNATKKTILEYLKLKNSGPPYIYNDYDSKIMKEFLKVLGISIIPQRLGKNSVVIFTKLLDTNYHKFDIFLAIKLACATLHLCQIDNPPDDLVIVVDISGVGFMHLTCLKMGPCITHLQYIQEGLPLKISSIHILNCNYVFNKALSLFKMFIKAELFQIIKTYSSNFECVPASFLPQENGGTLGPFQDLVAETWKDFDRIMVFLRAEQEFRSGGVL